MNNLESGFGKMAATMGDAPPLASLSPGWRGRRPWVHSVLGKPALDAGYEVSVSVDFFIQIS